jgi:hypothetical protein
MVCQDEHGKHGAVPVLDDSIKREPFLRFGGKPVDPRAQRYHSLELGEDIAAVCATALNHYDKPVTIFNESCKGTGKMFVVMHVLQRLRQVHPKLSVLFPHSRNALGAQQALDAAKCTAVKLSPRSPGQLPQVLEHIGGPPSARAWLPRVPVCFPELRIASHTDKDIDLAT